MVVSKKFKKITKDVADTYATLGRLRLKKFNWVDNKYIKDINKRDQRFKPRSADAINQSKRLSFEKQRNAIKVLIRNERNHFLQNRFDRRTDSRSYNEVLNSIIGKKVERITPSFEVETLDSDNEYFANVGPNLHESINQSLRISTNQQCNHFGLSTQMKTIYQITLINEIENIYS